MPIGKKMTVVLSVVVAGASVALFFRKDASPFSFWRKSSDDPFAQRVERRVSSGPGRSARTTFAGTRPRRVPPAATAAISEPRGLAAGSEPRFQRNLNPVGALLPPIEGIVGDADFEASDEIGSAAERRFAPLNGGGGRHVVMDGDTLTKLAVRYLGRAEAYLAIYEFNRDVLASPDLLPIGAELKIPPRESVIAGEMQGVVPDAREIAPDAGLKMAPPPRRFPGHSAR